MIPKWAHLSLALLVLKTWVFKVKNIGQVVGKLAKNCQKWGKIILFLKPKLVSMELFYIISWTNGLV